MIAERIAALAADSTSGASGIVARAVGILRDALAGDADVAETARALVRAQPSMAPMWNAALAALAGAERFETFAVRLERAPTALARTALALFTDPPRHVVTISYSGSVAATIEALLGRGRLTVTCSESAPAMEGRALAARLAAAGASVTCTPDDGLDGFVHLADAVLAGADAVTAQSFVNKAGTRTLVAAAAAARVPGYVVASRDKFAGPAVAARLAADALFEPTPLAGVRGVITNDGVLEPKAVRRACEALDSEAPPSFLALLDWSADR